MASEMGYARQKYSPKRRRLSSKILKREAKSISYESLLKKQRIYSVLKIIQPLSMLEFQKELKQRSIACIHIQPVFYSDNFIY